MEIESFIKKIKKFYTCIIDFIEAVEDSDAEFAILIDIFEKQKILQNKDELRLIFLLLSKIADNHHRSSDFFKKLEQILQYLCRDTPKPISYFIQDNYKYNKQILFYLLNKKFTNPDESFLENYIQNILYEETSEIQSYNLYLYPAMKEFIEEKYQKQIEYEILKKYGNDIIEEKCQIGENDSYVCSLIREDSIEKFISFISRTNLSLCTLIEPSIYESNSYLIDKQPSLIEYAAFFGSIQIVQYLKYNAVPLEFSLWFYAIHSNNPELIHFLEDNDVKPETNEQFEDVFIESIKCHHNGISVYIKDNILEGNKVNDRDQFYDNFGFVITNSLNIYFYPDDFDSIISISKAEKGFNLLKFYLTLTQITIPSSVTSIGWNAFEGCSLLTQITFEIPSSLTSIGDCAFNKCSSLTKIIFPSSVTSIGYYTFSGCSSLKEITFEAPSSLTSIGHYVFIRCSSLTQITIPSSVTSIGNFAFCECSSLKQITIPSSVTSIGNCAFRGCSSLTQISIPSSVTSFGNKIFNGIKELEITGDIKHIPKGLFVECSSLTQIKIPSSAISIGNFVFCGCSSLKQVTFSDPSSVKFIGDSAFSECLLLTQITIPSSVTSIGEYAFSECISLTQITIPSSVTSIGGYAFYECSSLTQITIPSSVTSIGDFTFSGCSSLTQITIPSSVTSIADSAFDRCLSLPPNLKRSIYNIKSK